MSSAPSDDDPTILRSLGHGQPAAQSPATAATPKAAFESQPAVPPPPGPSASTAASGNALPAGTRLGEFELLGVLGEGGFGIVYTAQDHSLDRHVALKEYMPASLASRADSSQVRVRSQRHQEAFDLGLRSFVNEARLLAHFDHPSLVKVYRFWEANGTAYMVMPLYEGVTLKDKLRHMDKPPDEDWLVGLLAPLTEALSILHAQRCYHRDIAPDNIMLLADSERPLLLDFGAARRVISDMTQALTVILKPGYAPVEQYAEVPDLKQGPWTDVYALAATVHFAILGKTPPASVGRLMSDGFVPLASQAAGRYSERFLRAIDHALQVRPAERTQSIAALRDEIGLPPIEPGRGPDVSGPSQVLPRESAPSLSRAAGARSSKKVLVGGGAVALAAAGIAALLLMEPFKPAPPAVAPPAATPPTVAQPKSTPPTATPPPMVRAPFEIREEFDKVVAGQTAGFTVSAAPASSTLKISRDRLAFNVTSSRDGYVHVLVLGPDGSLLLLFPNGQSSDNRIRAGQTLTLPQPTWALDTSEPAGREEFLVIVSDQPRDYAELGSEREYIFLKLPTGRRGAELAAGWTRSTPLLLGSVKQCPTAHCETYAAATFGVDIVH
jgi:serine/threonine protein kinase